VSKPTITLLFAAAIAAVVAGMVIRIAAMLTGLTNGAVALGGPQGVTLNAEALAWTVATLVLASLVIGAGVLAAIAAWVGALVSSFRLEDKSWFVVLLVLGLVSLGWLALLAYVFAGPDSTPRDATTSAVVAS
jgi:hypothetical protein